MRFLLGTIKPILAVLGLSIILFGCRKETVEDAVFELNPIKIIPPNTGKTKIKSSAQYISILHTNFFQKAISVSDLVDYTDALYSMGDQQLAREILISNFMNDETVIIPPDNEIRTNFEPFLIQTYQRFLVRNPSESEKVWFQNFVDNDPNVTSELVYFSFALSSEYQAY
ncbi:MAG: hypothetical protein ACI9YL_000237 [Luteibaculaceae bacterium]|jgi:hypothetical protein